MAYDKQREYEQAQRSIRRRVRLLAALLILAAGTFLFVLGAAVSHDGGMAPAIGEGRPLVYLKLGQWRRGDVLVLRPEGEGTLVRRVVGVPGDTVELRGGAVILNGLSERGSYSILRTDPVEGGPDYPLVLRQGEYFVLADRRGAEPDSRSFGAVSGAEILGRVLF